MICGSEQHRPARTVSQVAKLRRLASIRPPALAFVGLAGDGIREGQQIVPAGQGQFNAFSRIQVGIHCFPNGHYRPWYFLGSQRKRNRRHYRIDEIGNTRFPSFQHHTRYRALVEVEQEGRTWLEATISTTRSSNRSGEPRCRRTLGFGSQDGRHFIDHVQRIYVRALVMSRPAAPTPAMLKSWP